MIKSRVRRMFPVVAGLAILLGGPTAVAEVVKPQPSEQAADGWEEHLESPRPSSRNATALAYDPAVQQTVLFGGFLNGVYPEMWTWDGVRWQRFRADELPPARGAHVMEYDPAREEIVLFGGFGNRDRTYADTWVFRDGEWSKLQPAVSPPARYYSAMAYDPQSERMILFGGQAADRSSLGDTWAWDGENWTELEPSRSPQPRERMGFATDPTRNAPVLFGGSINDGSQLGDTWRWDGEAWVEEFPRKSPSARSLPAMSTFGDQVLLFSGTYGLSQLQRKNPEDTWVLKADTWKRLSLAENPRGRGFAAMEWDAARNEAVLFGGTAHTGRCQPRTWTLDLEAVAVAPGGTTPDESVARTSKC